MRDALYRANSRSLLRFLKPLAKIVLTNRLQATVTHSINLVGTSFRSITAQCAQFLCAQSCALSSRVFADFDGINRGLRLEMRKGTEQWVSLLIDKELLECSLELEKFS